MKQLNWYQIFGKSNIPDGRTVLPTDDIQILLHCADIWDKTYTTLSELLADTDTLLAVISSNNAIDYLVRSTTWASGVSADSSAMTYIGLNNYASNTLLADSTWCNAICNSAYFESVLNVKVPTMTSNTTPEGLVFAKSAYGSQQPYQAFDGNDNTAIHTANYSTIEDWWIGYMFTSAVKVYKVTYLISQAQSQAITFTAKVQASADNVTYTDISNTESVSISAGGGVKVSGNIISNNSLDGQYCRIFTNGKGVTPNTLQFYGRKDV